MSSLFSAALYVIRPPEEAWVERLADGDWLLRWRQPAARVAVYASADPDVTAGDRPLSVGDVSNGELRMTNAAIEAAVGGPSSAVRPYFLLALDDRRLVVAERTLPLTGEANFRDLGGYATADGRAVRWGRVYRAGSLADLTEADMAYLARLGLRLAWDLRSPDEVANHPDRLPPGAVARHTPIIAEVGRLRGLVTLFRLRRRVQKMLQQVYVIMLDQNGPLLAGILRAAADPANLPLVIHCTAGKDRTGLAAALLLSALGVPEETIIADYTLSNNAFDGLAERMRPEMERLYAFGFNEQRLRPFLLAEARTLTGALAHLRRRYGSVEAYLRRAGLTEDDLGQLRQTLLTIDG